MKGVSSYQRSSKYLRGKGWKIYKTEFYARGKRFDLLGIFDAIGFTPDHKIYFLQFCGGSDWNAHVRKMLGERADSLQTVLECDASVMLIGWRKLKVTRGGTAMHWVPRIATFTLAGAVEIKMEEIK